MRTGLAAGDRLRVSCAIGALARRLQQVLQVPNSVGVKSELLAECADFRRQRLGPAGELKARTGMQV